MFDCRIPLALVLTSTFASTSAGQADTVSEISQAIEEFGVQCAPFTESPVEFYKSARSEGDESHFMVTRSDDGLVHLILRMDQREMLIFHIGRVDGRTRVSCQYTLIFDDALQSTTDVNNDAFLAAIAVLSEANVTGGAMAISGILSEQSANPHTIYDYVISGWPDIEQVVSASIQEGFVRLDVARVFSQQLRLD